MDSDQKYIADDVIICSMMKQVGDSIYEAVSDYISGDTSKWGTTWVADMATGFIGIGYGEAGSTQQVPDELKAEVVDMYKQVYAKAKYTVDTATEVDDGTFGVKVTVEPLDVFDRVAEALWGDTPDARAEALYSQDVDSMTDEEYAAYDAEWCRLVIDLTLEKLPEAEYLEAQSKVVQITLGDDNYWSLDEQDFSDLDWLILDYNF